MGSVNDEECRRCHRRRWLAAGLCALCLWGIPVVGGAAGAASSHPSIEKAASWSLDRQDDLPEGGFVVVRGEEFSIGGSISPEQHDAIRRAQRYTGGAAPTI